MADLTGHDWTGFTKDSMTVSASSYLGASYPYRIFTEDLVANQYWLTNGVVAGWIKLDFGLGNQETVVKVGIQVNTIPEPNRAPKDFTVQGSNDDSNWDILETVTGETSWASGEKRDFILSSSGAYRYYKIDITDNNGDGSYTQIEELFLYSAIVDRIIAEQNIAQVEWQDPSKIDTTQNIAQVEWSDIALGWTGKISGVTNPAKINGVAVANISKVMGL